MSSKLKIFVWKKRWISLFIEYSPDVQHFQVVFFKQNTNNIALRVINDTQFIARMPPPPKMRRCFCQRLYFRLKMLTFLKTSILQLVEFAFHDFGILQESTQLLSLILIVVFGKWLSLSLSLCVLVKSTLRVYEQVPIKTDIDLLLEKFENYLDFLMLFENYQ